MRMTTSLPPNVYNGGLFHCYILDEPLVILRVPCLIFRFYSILMENSLSKYCRSGATLCYIRN